ncbi:hypothetical protein QR680_004073 [Steinernema hermaphroditum]|uniref:Uncharacterized protein n=1 Tax=Steinernema hermaphroditum TaxID=289476 RepID=A0AA39LTF7_9BILA|nr:hypothetical protein QR680_004073 [Steinernema hermaphroditum]
MDATGGTVSETLAGTLLLRKGMPVMPIPFIPDPHSPLVQQLLPNPSQSPVASQPVPPQLTPDQVLQYLMLFLQSGGTLPSLPLASLPMPTSNSEVSENYWPEESSTTTRGRRGAARPEERLADFESTVPYYEALAVPVHMNGRNEVAPRSVEQQIGSSTATSMRPPPPTVPSPAGTVVLNNVRPLVLPSDLNIAHFMQQYVLDPRGERPPHDANTETTRVKPLECEGSRRPENTANATEPMFGGTTGLTRHSEEDDVVILHEVMAPAHRVPGPLDSSTNASAIEALLEGVKKEIFTQLDTTVDQLSKEQAKSYLANAIEAWKSDLQGQQPQELNLKFAALLRTREMMARQAKKFMQEAMLYDDMELRKE